MSSSRYVIEGYDKDDIPVTCDKEAWDHITRHVEMIGKEKIVQAIVGKPQAVYASASVKGRVTLYKRLVLPPPIGDTFIRVVVEYKNSPFKKKRGYICNAFSCRGKQQGEVLIWGTEL